MSSPSQHHRHRTWTREDGYVISTDTSLIPLASLNAAFGSPQLYWAKPVSTSDLRTMVDNSLCFALYYSGPETQADANTATMTTTATTTTSTATSTTTRPLIGFARLVTDYVTLTYLTDVYVLPDWQGRGLGRWLIECVQEVVEAMPQLRRSMAITSNGAGGGLVGWYEQTMKMKAVNGTEAYTVMEWKGPGNVF